jgi:SWI/SNF-related matrix-associated actin-dependent regulator of chromatin subfamily A3
LQGISLIDAEVPNECTSVTLDFEENMLKAYLRSKRNCVAMYASKELHRLVTEYAVTLTATVCGKRPKSTRMSKTEPYIYRPTQSAASTYSFWKLRIIVYGFLKQKDNVANILNKERLFLQHPGETEIDRRVKYFNPQYLLAPGDDMPPLEKLNISKCCVGSSEVTRNLLQDHERNQILKIFDTAYKSGDAMAMAEPSPRLVTQLKR